MNRSKLEDHKYDISIIIEDMRKSIKKYTEFMLISENLSNTRDKE